MRLHDRFRNSQAEPGAAARTRPGFVDAKEPLEDVGYSFGRNAHACIGDSQGDSAVLPSRRYADFTFGFVIMDRVRDEVCHYLRERLRIALILDGREIALNDNLSLGGERAKQFHTISSGLGQIK